MMFKYSVATLLFLFLGLLAPLSESGTASSAALPQVQNSPTNQIFLTAPAYSTGGQARSFVLADVNGDGKPDVIFIDYCTSHVGSDCFAEIGVMLGNGDGTFQSPSFYETGGTWGTSFAIGDVNGDGKLDVVAEEQCASPNVEDGCFSPGVAVLLLGDGAGHFGSPTTIGPFAGFVTLADVNGDGKLDMIVVNGGDPRNGHSDNTSIGVSLGNGDGTFQSQVNYGSGGYGAQSVVVADVNGDGKPDLLVPNLCISSASCTTGTIGVLLNNGSGGFQSAVAYHASSSAQSISVAVADINGDGKPDLVVAGGPVSVLLGNGNGTFQAAASYNSNGGAISVAVGELNGDSKPDVVSGGSGLDVLLGNGNGTLQSPVNYGTGDAPDVYSQVAIADLNGDGKADVLFLNGASIGVLLGNGDGSLRAAAIYSSGLISGGGGVIAADVNGDGKPDLILIGCAAGTNCATNSVSVLLNNGNGTFKPGVVYGAGGSNLVYNVVAADVNGDGSLDLIVANLCSGTNCSGSSHGAVGVLLNNGNGTFQPAVTYASGGFEGTWVRVADVNGDGKPDLVLLNNCNTPSCSSPRSGSVSVLLNTGDGTFQPAMTFNTPDSIPDDIAVADLNGDGKPDLAIANFCDTASDCSSTLPPGTVRVLLGNGDGTFTSAGLFDSGGVEALSVQIADVNGDGKPDLVVGNQYLSGNTGRGGIGVLLGNGDGTFQSAITTGPSGTSFFALADFNGDGKLDLALSGNNGLLLGNGDGTFQSPLPLSAPGSGLAVADFNGDNRPDLASGPMVLLNIFSANNPATVNLTSSMNPAAVNQPVTLTAAVTGSGGAPGGSVSFMNGPTLMGTVPLSGGQATFGKAFPVAGTKSLTAVYSGDFSFASASSAVLSEGVGGDPTSTALSSNLNPALPGQYVGFTAMVSSSFGSPTGSVTFFKNGTQNLGTVALNGGQATLYYNFGSPNTKSITAAYSGDTNFAASTSPVLNEVVSLGMTTTTVASSVNPSVVGESVMLTATVSSASGTPTGMVSFMNGSNTMGTVALSGGQATFNKVFPSIGMRSITALYLGAGSFAGSTSAVLSQQVNQSSTTTTLVSSMNPSAVGQSVTFTATVTPQFGGTPTGTVTFMNGTVTMGTVTLTSGQAMFTRAFPASGMKSITATYSGDSNYSTSSAGLTQTVQ